MFSFMCAVPIHTVVFAVAGIGGSQRAAAPPLQVADNPPFNNPVRDDAPPFKQQPKDDDWPMKKRPMEEIPPAPGVTGDAALDRLLADLASKNPFKRSAALKSLGKYRDERVVVPIVECMKDFGLRNEAVRTIRQLGAIAEKEVAKYVIERNDPFLRLDAVKLLGEIGTQASIQPLQELIMSNDPVFGTQVRSEAKQSIASIEARTKK